MKVSELKKRKFSKNFSKNPMAEINVTPFVDVMLVLLIVFMITAPLLTTGIKIDFVKKFVWFLLRMSSKPQQKIISKTDFCWEFQQKSEQKPDDTEIIGR